MPRRKKNSILNAALRGIIAGATGTVALDISTYLDMSIRGRSSSNAPSQMIDTVAKKNSPTPVNTDFKFSRSICSESREWPGGIVRVR